MRRETAALYLDMSEAAFTRCVAPHVASVDFGARGRRWAHDALDRWVDSLTANERPTENEPPMTVDQRRRKALERL